MTILTEQFSFKNVDWAIASGGDARDGNTSFTLSGVNGNMKSAFLYWGELNFSGSSDTTISFNGQTINGTRLGTSVDTCWGSDHSIGYFANVTSLVNGNGTYSIDGMGIGGQGATLVAFYDDGNVTNNRDVTLFAGNDSTNTGGAITTIDLGQIDYDSGNVNVTLSVGDGQSFRDGALTVNNNVAGTNLFPGSSGALWDVVNIDLTPYLSVGSNKVKLKHETAVDCLQFVNAIVDTPAKPPVLFLDFMTAIPIDFYVAKSKKISNFFGFGDKEIVAERSGSEPLGLFTTTQQAQIVQLTQDIFDRSGIAMEVTATKPTSGDYHSVRYSSDKLRYDHDGNISTNDAQLLGRAYQNVDQFNKKDNDIVAVFMDGSDPLIQVAETTTHEAAHAFGGRHVNPVQGSGSEVLDYDPSGLESFVNTPVKITEPPIDGKPASSTTHNPTYHIRRYVGGESDEQLRLENIHPGTYDRGFFNKVFYFLGMADLGTPLDSLSLLIPGLSDQVEEHTDDSLGILTLLGENLQETDVLSFSLPEDTPFQIVGSTNDDTVLDVVFEFDPLASDPYTLVSSNNISLSGNLVVGDTQQSLTSIGTFDLSVTDVIPVLGEGFLDTVSLSVSIDMAAISENNDTAIVTISRGNDVVGDLPVILSSNDTSEALVPNFLTIPDGESKIDVVLSSLDDALQDGIQTVTITALANGYEKGTAMIDILDDELPIINELFGTNSSDYLVGTDTADIIHSLGGSYDRSTGGLGADIFVFGAETLNGRRERDVITDYEVGIDAILLEDGASIGSIRQTSTGAVVFLEGDLDAIYVQGENVLPGNLTFLPENLLLA